MSVDSVKAFYGKVEEDKALQAKLKALDKKARTAQQALMDELIDIAKATGCQFTPEDLAKAGAEQCEESPVGNAGGGVKYEGCWWAKGPGWCGTNAKGDGWCKEALLW